MIRRPSRHVVTLALILALMVAVNFLPPDTSYAQVREAGVLRVCVPSAYPPLVTGDEERPGIDVEILRAVAERLDVRLALNTISSMGRDFNPRNWRVTRAQCSVLAGGVVASGATRSFLETTPSHLETGWALIAPEDVESLADSTVGFFGGVSGLDRIALSRYLRMQNAEVVTVSEAEDLVEGLREGGFTVGVTEALRAREIAADTGWTVQWLPSDLGRFPVVFGLWKGDLTLKRAIVGALERLERSGTVGAILDDYELHPIEQECAVCVDPEIETAQGEPRRLRLPGRRPFAG